MHVPRRLEIIDLHLTQWMARNGIPILRVSLGIIFFWFGILKFLPGLSPAEDIAGRTIQSLSFGLVTPNTSLPLLAGLECLIGIGLMLRVGMRIVLFLLFFQMAGTLTPLFLFPNEVFLKVPYAPTLEGQYIIKNLVLIASALVLGATVRGGRLRATPSYGKARQETDGITSRPMKSNSR